MIICIIDYPFLLIVVSNNSTGYYEVDTEVVKETMRVVTPPISDYKHVGYYIARECEGVPTYMLEKVVTNGKGFGFIVLKTFSSLV